MLDIVKKEIAESLAAVSGLSYGQSFASLEMPKPGFGDLSSKIAFMLAPQRKENPAKIAASLVANIKPGKFIEKIVVVGPYLNFYFSDAFYAETLGKMLKAKEKFGKGKKTGKKMIVEFFHANTHKGVHIGHIRNASLGEALSRILEFNGNKIIRVNYQGDIGPHVAKCMWGLESLYHNKMPEDAEVMGKGAWLGKVYTAASNAIKENPDLEAQAQAINTKLYAGDKAITAVWKKTRKWCLDDFEKFYKEFGIKFNALYFESQTEKIGKKLVLALVKKGIAKLDQGAIIMDFRDENLGVFVLLTKEGYPLYSAKDLGLAKLKFAKYNPDKSIHVVGKEQEFYFKQLFHTFKKIGQAGDAQFAKAADISYHLIYELVMLPEGKMSSREGTMVLYEDLKQKLLGIATTEVKKRHEDWDAKQIESTAKKIALAAIKFSMLRRESNRTFIFDWNEALSLEGDSGPYLQYAHVRTASILRRAEFKPAIAASYKFNDNEKAMIKRLCEFPDASAKAAKDLSPHVFVQYLLDLGAELNKFYTTSQVLNAEKEDERKTRLAIILATGQQLKSGLGLLGIDCPEKM